MRKPRFKMITKSIYLLNGVRCPRDGFSIEHTVKDWAAVEPCHVPSSEATDCINNIILSYI